MAAWQTFEARALWVVRNTFILSFAVRWEGSGPIKFFGLPQYSGYKRDKYNDKKLCQDIWRVLDQADIVVAHNGDAFDFKKINARLAFHGFSPPSPRKSIDTLKEARKHFKFDSNRLDDLARYLGIGRKLAHTGQDLWRDCENGDDAAWRMMERYNKHDVYLLEQVHKKLVAWGSPPEWRSKEDGDRCPNPICRSFHTIYQGTRLSRTRRYQRMQCQDCSTWFKGKLIK